MFFGFAMPRLAGIYLQPALMLRALGYLDVFLVMRHAARKGGANNVTRLCVTVLAALVLASPLGSCSRKGPAPDVSFLPTAAVGAADKEAAFETAKEACLEEAQRKGISSVTRILLLKGKTSKSDYIECMESKGFAETG